jgi:copper chaperone
MDSITMKIGGMTCGGCAATVTRVLRAVNGVSSVDVSLEQAAARVEYDPGAATREQLTAAVEAAGFDASL